MKRILLVLMMAAGVVVAAYAMAQGAGSDIEAQLSQINRKLDTIIENQAKLDQIIEKLGKMDLMLRVIRRN